jgi:hypothetical protein
VDGNAGIFKQWIFDQFDDDDHLAIVDDDVKLFRRVDLYNSPKLINLNDLTPDESEKQKCALWRALERNLYRGIPFVGISYRMGNNNIFVPYKYNQRCFGLWAIHRPTLIQHNIRLDTMRVMEDLYCILALLTRGYRNMVYYKWVWNGLANSKGGCSTWRTPEIQAEGARQLQSYFPEFVSIKERKPKSECWFGRGEPRLDVTCQWQKAYQYGETQISCQNFE